MGWLKSTQHIDSLILVQYHALVYKKLQTIHKINYQDAKTGKKAGEYGHLQYI